MKSSIDATMKILQLSAPGSTLLAPNSLDTTPCVSILCLPDVITRQDLLGLAPLCLYATVNQRLEVVNCS